MTNEVNVPIQLDEGVSMPKYSNPTDAGMDVCAKGSYAIAPGSTVIIPTGIRMAIPEGYELQVRPRSGLTVSTKLRVGNAPGTVDAGYRDEIGIIIDNVSDAFLASSSTKVYDIDKNHPDFVKGAHGTYMIRDGQRIAQIVLSPIAKANLVTVDDVKSIEGDRGGGFGHSGV